MKTDKEIFIQNFDEFTAALPDDINITTVWHDLRRRGNKMIRNNRRFGEILIRREIKRNSWPINIDGQSYNNAAKAAKSLGIDLHVVRHRLISPNFPTWVDRRIAKRINGSQLDHYGRLPLIVIINNIEYPSITAASKVLGMSSGSVYHRLHSILHPEWNIK
jgi:hypothetical protein